MKQGNKNYRFLYLIIAISLISIAGFRIILTYTIFNNTVDEPVHIACGIEWYDRGTYIYGPDHPPLARIAFGFLPFFAGIRLSETQLQLLNKIESNKIDWRGDYRWIAGNEILYSNNNYFYNLSLARLGNIPFFLLLCLVTWRWSRRLFGDINALLVLFFVSSTPSILGHAGLATTDIAVTSLSLSALYAFILWLELPNFRHSIIFGLTFGLSAIAKFSSLLFLPISALAILFIKFFSEKRNKCKLNYQSLTDQSKPILLSLIIIALVLFVVIWSGYRFSISSLTTPELRPHKTIDRILGEKGKLKDFAYFISESSIFPFKEFFRGIQMLKAHNDRGHESYLLGAYSTQGWWYFFPIVFFIKTPLSFLLFVAIGSIALTSKFIRTRKWQFFVPFISAITIMLSVLPANINLGIRHILVVYPLLAIVAGYGATFLLNFQKQRLAGRILFVIFISWYIFSTSFSHPDYIAYFNELADSSPEKIRNDSDLDWGQDLKRLSIELKRRNIKKLSLGYFGSSDPNKFNLPPFTTLRRHQSTTGWVAISLFKLKDISGPPPHDGFAWLEKYEPITTIGKSIKLYYIPIDS
jgi:hypothetical protein